jgi:hypothetical protein
MIAHRIFMHRAGPIDPWPNCLLFSRRSRWFRDADETASRLGMKVIFLDIDGVLNSDQTSNPRKLPYIVDRKLLARFKRVLKHTCAKVVLSFTWR